MSSPVANHVVSHDALVGQTLGHYSIIEKIGAGGMGEVFRAHDEHLDRDVAIKVLTPGTLGDESARKRFHKEALTLSKLNHPNIATIYDFDTQRGVDFLVMEYIPGTTLDEKLGGRPLPEKEVAGLGAQLAEGLSAAHEHGVIHRDLKPGNLQLSSEGRLKILDFGLARLRLPVTPTAATESLSETHTMAGTLPYMAPEQLLGGEIDARTDIHAAGEVLYEMATGQQPFAQVERSQLIGAILHKPPRPPSALNPKLSPELGRMIGKCLEKDPENRYQSAKELGIDLRRLQTGALSATQVAARATKWWPAKLARLGLGILVTVVVLLIAFNVGGWRGWLLARRGSPKIESLAVLPLDNFSGDPAQEFFADGMTEALIAELGQIGSLRVISRTSVMQYKGAKKPLTQIARELNVDAVIEGSVLRDGNKVRITAQLIGTEPERHLWARNYERNLRDVLSLQGEIARAIADEVKANVTPGVQERLASARPVNPEAHEAYLKGQFFFNRLTEADFKQAILYAQQAVQIDPDYAAAYGLLATSYWLSSRNGWGSLPNREAAEKAKAAAMKALAIDDTLAEPHIALGMVLVFHDWDWARGEREFKRAIELNPNSVLAHTQYAWYLMIVGRQDESIREADRAVELDPFSVLASNQAVGLHFFGRQYDQALEINRKCREVFGVECSYWVIAVLDAKGMYDQEVAAWQETTRGENKPEDSAALGRAYKAGGIKGVWRWDIDTRLKRLKERADREQTWLSDIGVRYAELGETDKALDWLEKAYEEHDDLLAVNQADPRIDSLRSEPRFQELQRRMNLPQ